MCEPIDFRRLAVVVGEQYEDQLPRSIARIGPRVDEGHV